MKDADLVGQLYRRAAAHGISMAKVCEQARIAPTTPSRWRRKRNGASLDRVVRLHAALNELIGQAELNDARVASDEPADPASA